MLLAAVGRESVTRRRQLRNYVWMILLRVRQITFGRICISKACEGSHTFISELKSKLLMGFGWTYFRVFAF